MEKTDELNLGFESRPGRGVGPGKQQACGRWEVCFRPVFNAEL